MLVEKLRSQVTMKTFDRDAGNAGGTLDGERRVSIPQRKPEFRIEHASGDLVMRVDIDSRIHPQQHWKRLAAARCQLLEQIELVQVIDRNELDPGFDGLPQLLSALVIAMKRDDLGSTPLLSATKSSPPETTSIPSPSSASIARIDRQLQRFRGKDSAAPGTAGECRGDRDSWPDAAALPHRTHRAACQIPRRARR